MANPRNRRLAVVKAGGALLVLALLALLVRSRMGHLLEPGAASQLLHDVRASRWAVPGFLAAYGALTSLFAPAMAFHVAAGAVWGFTAGYALNLAAFHVTSNLQFLAARRLGAGWVVDLVGEARVLALEAWLGREGLRAALLVRLLPLPNMAVNVAAGLSPVRWRDFALGTFLGTLPSIAVPTAFAAGLARGAEGAHTEALLWLVAGGAGVLGMALLTRRLAPRTPPPAA